MFIKKLIISTEDKVIRDLTFKMGMNLVVDNTPTDNKQLTGNNVGKTTVLKLIYFCLGGNGNQIYTDDENSKSVYQEIKDYLINNKILITLILVDDLNDEKSKSITIERNFLSRNKIIRKINGESFDEEDFFSKLSSLIFPNLKSEKPSFKQVISHNIRYTKESVTNTLKTLNQYTSDLEYESLYLFLLGFNFTEGAEKQSINKKIEQEKNYKNRLEKTQTKNSYEMALALIEDDIVKLNKKKDLLNINENFEEDFEELNKIRIKINKCSSNISNLEIRRDIIREAKEKMEHNKSCIDLNQLEILYREAKENIGNLQKTFEELVEYHNKMIIEKIKFISADLPDLEHQIETENNNLKELLNDEKEYTLKISKKDSFEDLDILLSEINEKYRQKGEYENIISQIKDTDTNISKLEKDLDNISKDLYSAENEEKLNKQITKFNKYFSDISNKLYGEKYLLKSDKELYKKTQNPVYKFTAFNSNMSTGKKQGEILCFDLAYILFANNEKMPCLDFLLNDKKELMHDNQLLEVADFVKENNIQLVISILKDKIPDELINKSYTVVELSQDDKLFRC